MLKIKKLVAVAAALAIAVTGITVDTKKANARNVSNISQITYTTERAPEQDNDINQTDKEGHPYYYTGQIFLVTGFKVDNDDRIYNVNCKGSFPYDWLDGENDPIPESEDDYILAVSPAEDTFISAENGVWKTTRLNQHTYFYPAARNDNGELRYKWDNAILLYSFYNYSESIYITDADGRILDHTWDSNQTYVIAKSINDSTNYGVKTINSQYSIEVSSDNEDVAVVKKDGRNFTIETKSAGVANITVVDEKGNEALVKYMVTDQTQLPHNSSNNNAADTSVSTPVVSTPVSAPVSPYKYKAYETVTKNANGETIRTFVHDDGYISTSLASNEEVVPAGSSFTSEEIQPTTQYFVTINEILQKYMVEDGNVNSSLHNFKIGKMVEFDLADMSGAAIHQLDGYVTVSMDMPSDMVVKENQVVKVYRVAEDGTVVPCPTIVENGVIQFATNHFSTYVFVIEDQVASTAGTVTNAKKSPKTGEE